METSAIISGTIFFTTALWIFVGIWLAVIENFEPKALSRVDSVKGECLFRKVVEKLTEHEVPEAAAPGDDHTAGADGPLLFHPGDQ
jgi:hypothetical protein